MIAKYLIFLFALLNSFASISQEIASIDTIKWLCQYDYSFLQDSTSRYSLKKINMILQVGSHSSCFSDQKEYVLDSLHYADRNYTDFGASAFNAFQKTSGIRQNLLCKYKIYKNYPANGQILFRDYVGKFVQVTEPKTMKWKLEANSDTMLLGYKCKKASIRFAGRTYTAWFAPQIPLAEGPYKFNGLPGLILKIYDSKKLHCFEARSISRLKYNRPIYYSLNEHIDLSTKEYLKAFKFHISELLGRMQNNNIGFNKVEDKGKSVQKLKSINNFIEKY